jgi:(4S)-4-hydroxy-5-phosphonooxypentane-2,3-dione isomerase
MTVTCVTVYVKKDRIEDFIEATIRNHESSIQEKGNLRFDVLQSLSDPCRFTLYEAYASEETAGAHKHTVHYLEWRDTVAPWMERPREGLAHRVIAPGDEASWKK